MGKQQTRSRIGLCAVALLSSLQLGAGGVTDNFDQRVLEAQNAERAKLGLPALQWNDQLVASAQRWANYLSTTGRFEHAPEQRFAPEGENLWEGSRGYFNPEAMVNAWAREKRYFKPGLFPNNSVTGRVEDVGHYTQLVWRRTTDVGCAMASNGSVDVLVCRYSQAGNYIGQKPF